MENNLDQHVEQTTEQPVKRGRGRPKGSGKKQIEQQKPKKAEKQKVKLAPGTSNYAYFRPADDRPVVAGEITYVDGVKYTVYPYLGPDASKSFKNICRQNDSLTDFVGE
jgi:hypothetical protein